MANTRNLSLEQIELLAHNALFSCGATGPQLKFASQSIVDAECDGLQSVGLSYLPTYCEHLIHNKIRGDAVPQHSQTSPSSIRSDAANGFPHAAFAEVEKDFYHLANTQGIAALTIVNSYSAGVVGWFVERMARAGLIGICFANSSAAVAPAPGASAFFGTNPIAFGVPRDGAPPVVADMSTSQVAFVTIAQNAAANKPIPEGWGYDAEGEVTQDAKAILEGGSLAPVGGYKGALLALLVDVLAGALAGPNCSYQASSFGDNEGGYPAVGQFFIGIDPLRFSPESSNQFGSRMELLLQALASEPGVRLPGDRRQQCRQNAEEVGVSVPVALIDRLEAYTSR